MAVINWNGKWIDDKTGDVYQGTTDEAGNPTYTFQVIAKDPQALSQITENSRKLEEDKHKRDQARGYDDNGRPVIKDFESILDPATGQLKDIYQLKRDGDVTYNADGYNKIKDLALRNGPSTWALMMQDKQKLEEGNAMDRSRTQATNAQNQALSSLAMRGGISGGARDRLASQAVRNQMMGQQQIMNQGALARQDIGVKDESNRYDMLKNLTALDAEKAKLDLSNRDYRTRVDQANLQNQLREVDARRAYDTGTYKERMAGYAAEQQAAAQRNSGGGK